MMKFTALILIAGCSTFVFAQSAKTNPFSLRVGMSWPTDSEVKAIKKNGITFGLGYELSSKPVDGKLTKGGIYLDYHKLSSGGSEVTSWGIGYHAMQNLTMGNAGTPPVMAGLGLGYYSVKGQARPVQTGGGEALTAGQNTTSGRLGGKAFVSCTLGRGVDLVAAYNLIGSKDGIKPSYFSVELGYKF